MPTIVGSLRRHVLAPPLRQVGFTERRFPVRSSAATRHLEAIPQAVVCGFEWGIGPCDLWEAERRLALVDPYLRGFAYEGVTMAFTIRDAMSMYRTSRARDLLAGPGRPHIFLNYIGIGFAMARLPRPLWRRIVPDLSGVPYHPTMSWLAVDGYGFDLAYFDTDRWVRARERPRPYPWEGSPDYFLRAVDQGIGRALWFVHAGRPDDVAAAVDRFATERQADLWAGVGLAATFAGGCDPAGLASLRRRADGYRPHLAQGAVFAARARTFSGAVPPHTDETVVALTGLPVAAASALADEVAVGGLPASRGEPAYEVWRRRVRAHFDAEPAGAPGS
ncbi:DUF1702 family protein [Micromonospora eburnea]|uniref:Enediyne biosynthesis protein n=1 Tax=Micromonospora eburnea TaxID=227316 RepID=A0A1C6UTU6_9ACTN|nr:DUF1702 family protein [Micromonospora eburnea]SCL57455.1 Protein of unknown function [Micromonospora eburnea]